MAPIWVIDLCQFVQLLAPRSHHRQSRFGRFIQRFERGPGRLQQSARILLNAPLGFELHVFTRAQIRAFDFVPLELPEIEHAQLFLVRAFQLRDLIRHALPCREKLPHLPALRRATCANESSMASCAAGFEQKLLIVLAVDIAKVWRQILQQSDGGRTVIDENPALAVRQDFAVEQQLAFPQRRSLPAPAPWPPPRRSRTHPKRARAPAGTDHVGRCAAAQQQSQRIHHDRFAAARLASEQIEARVKSHAKAVDHGVIFNHQLVQHSIRL